MSLNRLESLAFLSIQNHSLQFREKTFVFDKPVTIRRSRFRFELIRGFPKDAYLIKVERHAGEIGPLASRVNNVINV